MGWLFNKKKTVPKVPFPEGRPFDEKSLQFPLSTPSERTIRPEQVQAAVGLGQPINVPEEAGEITETTEPSTEEQQLRPNLRQAAPRQQISNSFMKIEVYKKILSEIDEMKRSIGDLKEASKNLDVSEYNEETHFIKMRRATKAVHDRLLQIDKTIFKGE